MKQATKLTLTGLTLLAIASSGFSAESKSTGLRRAPDFMLPDCLGNMVSLREFRGRIVLLQFFQTGCPTCQHEAPLLEALYRKFRDRGVFVMAVSHDAAGAEVVREFAKKFDLTYPLLLGDLEIAVRYIGINPQQPSFDIPRFFLIDREGYIAQDIDPARDPGFLRDEKGALEKAIEGLLGSPLPAPVRPKASSN
jgi:peroxiredoxin